METHPASLLVALCLFTAVSSPAHAIEPAKELREVQNLSLPELLSVSSVVISRDGKFAYAAASGAFKVSTFRRDPASGELEFDDAIIANSFGGVVFLSFSKDEKYAVACAYASHALTLLRRDATNGRLSVVDSVTEGEVGKNGLSWVIAACFSPNGDFVYTGSMDGVGVYEVKAEKLSFVQFVGANGRLNGVREVALSPNGERLYVSAKDSGTLGVLKRDPATGLLTVAQILSNDDSGTKSLNGAVRAAVSSDGRFVYVIAGRFGGDQAISAFTVSENGELKLLQEFIDGTGEFTDFNGGNALALSPDGTSLFATASLSRRLFRFKRDKDSGKLTYVASQQIGKSTPNGSAGRLSFSPDGKFVYVANGAASSIIAFEVPK